MQEFIWVACLDNRTDIKPNIRGGRSHYIDELFVPTLVRCVMAAWHWSRFFSFLTTSFTRGAIRTQPIDFTIPWARDSKHTSSASGRTETLLKICRALPFHLHALLHIRAHATTTAQVSHFFCFWIEKTEVWSNRLREEKSIIVCVGGRFGERS